MRANRNLDPGAVVARVTSFSARRATLVVAVATLLSIAGVVLALMLDPGTDASAAGDGGGEAAAATKELRGRFGGDPIVVLVRGRLTGMLLTEDVARMLSLEGCISGNVPRDAKPAAPVCSELREAQARPGGLRARHLHQRGSGTDPRPDQLRPRRAKPPRPTAPRARRAARPADAGCPRPSRSSSPRRRGASSRPPTRNARWSWRCGSGSAACRRSTTRSSSCSWCSSRASGQRSRSPGSPTCSRTPKRR